MSEHEQQEPASTPTATESAKAKREAVTERVWLKDGEETKDPREATGLRITVYGTGKSVAGVYEAHTRQFAEPVQNALKVFGLNIVLTNTMGGLRGEDAFEAIMSRHETLEAGEWSSRKGAEGPRLSVLAQAIVAAKAKMGEERTVEEITEKLRAMSPEQRKAMSEEPRVKAEMARIRAEAAAEAARKAQAALGDQPADEEGGALADF